MSDGDCKEEIKIDLGCLRCTVGSSVNEAIKWMKSRAR